MIQNILIGLVSVVILIVAIGLLAWHYLRGDDEAESDLLRPEGQAASGHGDAVQAMAVPAEDDRENLPDDSLWADPDGGDSWADQLHQAGNLAATDILVNRAPRAQLTDLAAEWVEGCRVCGADHDLDRVDVLEDTFTRWEQEQAAYMLEMRRAEARQQRRQDRLGLGVAGWVTAGPR